MDEPEPSTSLARLINAATDLLGAAARDPVAPLPEEVRDGLRAALRSALGAADLLPAAIVATPPPVATGFAAYRLHAGPSFAIACTVTNQGVRLPIHDHGCWGLVGVYRGVEEEVRYAPPITVTAPHAVASGSHGDGGSPGLREVGRDLHHPGDVMVIDPPPDDVHLVASRGEEASVCIHLLGRDVVASGFNVFPTVGEGPRATGPLRYDPAPVSA